ncbi:hypothetical protein AHAS_Ahas03G0092600 [Arachis hypogaea]
MTTLLFSSSSIFFALLVLCSNSILLPFFRIGRKGKEPATSSSAPVALGSDSSISQSSQPDTFVNDKAEDQYDRLTKRGIRWERKLNIP